MDLAERKAWLRRMLGARRQRVDAGQVLAAGRQVADWLSADPGFAAVEDLGLYAAVEEELATRPLFELALERRKRLHLPRCRENGGLDFFEVEAWEDLRPGRYGLLEPDPSLNPTALSTLDWVVVPGVAFDGQGNRLGRGAGYYDRTFTADVTGEGPLLIGCGYAFQQIEVVPAGRLDRSMDAVVTELGLSWVPRSLPSRPRGQSAGE